MCGINGIQGSNDLSLITKMNDAISHRGPDGNGVFQNKNTALGHVRLSIIDLSEASSQPIYSDCGNLILVFNGEIYNYKELRKSMLAKGYNFKSEGDGEVILALWTHHGFDTFSLLDGIFSLAIYNQITGDLVVARDHFGIKPLYYSLSDSGVIFSSEIKAILQDQSVSREIDLDSAASHLQFLWSPGEATILSAIKKVPIGSYIVFNGGSIVNVEKYYSIPSYSASLDEAGAEKALDTALVNTIKSQLVSDVEVGAFLSGGLDSSLVCAIAKSENKDFKEVFSIDITSDDKDGFTDDLPYAKRVAEELGLDLNLVSASSTDVSDLPSCIYYLDEPQADPAIINAFKICQLANSKGIKVLLSGAGGDDFFTGYRRHLAAQLIDKAEKVPQFLKSLIGYSSRLFKTNSTLGRRFHKLSNALNQKGDDALISLFSWMSKEDSLKLFKEELRGKIAFSGYDTLNSKLANSASSNNVEKVLDLEREFFLVDHNFNYTDKMSMANGVEVRVPLVSLELAKVASQIPTNQKLKGKEGKWILKKVAEKWLPKSVIYRSKTGFGAPLRSWLHGPLKPLIDHLLSEESVSKRGVFDYSEVQKIIKADAEGRGDYAYSIYALLTMEMWFRQFIDCPTPTKLDINEFYN
ncbi:asparagine synthase (glutamine-hydrolyzing) [Pseudoalteromonas sp. R3]|uniref:asparagine synthase (glutamine-hydrolyzing) n=1 Tax=Pseudoalteromonas sp. R3 TaxID=1709477 RepID=UPI000B023944|nr:asparagine synthase (glutamine-hydrolyzing) [Pseudoalteromonas sp. R3]